MPDRISSDDETPCCTEPGDIDLENTSGSGDSGLPSIPCVSSVKRGGQRVSGLGETCLHPRSAVEEEDMLKRGGVTSCTTNCEGVLVLMRDSAMDSRDGESFPGDGDGVGKPKSPQSGTRLIGSLVSEAQTGGGSSRADAQQPSAFVMFNDACSVPCPSDKVAGKVWLLRQGVRGGVGRKGDELGNRRDFATSEEQSIGWDVMRKFSQLLVRSDGVDNITNVPLLS